MLQSGVTCACSQPVASSTHVLVLFGDVFVCRQSNWQQIA